MELCRFAYNTLDKVCIELEHALRGLPLDDLESFLIKAQVHEEIISDLCPLIPVKIVASYPTNVKSLANVGDVFISLCQQEHEDNVDGVACNVEEPTVNPEGSVKIL